MPHIQIKTTVATNYDSIEIDDYISRHIDAEHPLLHELDRQTHLRTLAPRMLSGHQQGSLLRMIVSMIRPHTILEIGTFTGYSALCMAQALQDDAHIHTIEIDDELEPMIRSYFKRYEHPERITLHIGDALTVIVFIDGDKRTYPAYYEKVMPRLADGGYIIADNVLWDGKVTQPTAHADAQTDGIKRFNDMVAADTNVEKVILPIRDGLTIIRKKEQTSAQHHDD